MGVTDLPTPDQKPYTPYGAAEALLYDRSPEIILDGPAGTGKSRACLEKLNICMEKYPGSRALIARKTRKSLTESALVTYEQHVLVDGDPVKGGPAREQRHVYRYPNGSEVVIGGLDDTGKVMSTEYDLIYVQEARELTEADWEDLTSRLRNWRMPYQQIIGDTNPDAINHWLKRRWERGPLVRHKSAHQDNPSLWDHARGGWTERGWPYIQKLMALTGVRRDRLWLGEWKTAEGIVYDGWDPETHLVAGGSVGADWPRYLAVDFGFTNPLVCQWWAVDPDGRLWRYRELYRTQWLVEDAAHEIRRLSANDPKIRAIVCDHDAEDRATLERHLTCSCESVGLLPKVTCGTTAARKDVSPGIQVVAQRLRVAPDGRPRLSLLRDSRLTPDSLLAESGKPTCTEEEFEGYVWDDATKKLNPDGTYKAEEPLKKDDHGMDAMRYMVAYFDLNADLSKMHQPQRFDRGAVKQEPAVVRLPDNYPDPKKWYSRG